MPEPVTQTNDAAPQSPSQGPNTTLPGDADVAPDLVTQPAAPARPNAVSAITIPGPAAVLGYGGLIPFALGALGAWTLPLDYAAFMASAQIYYAAIILSFLGAVHWGWALERDFHAPTTGWEPYAWGITPAVIAWFIVVLSVFPTPGRPGDTLLDLDQTVTLLIAGMLLSLLVDLKQTRQGRFPQWYRRLRLHLTFGAVACLSLSLLRILIS